MTKKMLLMSLLLLATAVTPLIAQVQVEMDTTAEPSITELAIQYAHNPLNWPSLHYAIKQNRIDVADLILQLYPEQATQLTPTIKVVESNIGASDYDYNWVVGYECGVSSLELAICGGYTELVAQLLEMGANVNEFRTEYDGGFYGDSWTPYRQPQVYERCKFGNTMQWTARSPLYWAIMREDSNMVALLLKYGARLTPCLTTQRMDYSSWDAPHIINATSALRLAAERESTAIFDQLLIEQAGGLPLDDELIVLFRDVVTNSENLPALHYAISVEDRAIYTMLLDYGFDIHYQGNSPKSLLNRAVEAQDDGFLEALLAREDLGSAALAYAVAIGDANTVRQLTEHTVATSELLKMALAAGDFEVAKAILTQPHSMETDGEALKLAIQKGYDELVKLMVHELGYFDDGALATAIEAEHEGMFFLLLDKGDLDPNAIYLAIEHSQLKMVEALITRDAPASEEVTSCMKRSIELGQVEIVHLFLDYSLPSDEELTQYKRWAIEFSQPDILVLLMAC